MPSQEFVWGRSKNFTSDAPVRIPPSTLGPPVQESLRGQRGTRRVGPKPPRAHAATLCLPGGTLFALGPRDVRLAGTGATAPGRGKRRRFHAESSERRRVARSGRSVSITDASSAAQGREGPAAETAANWASTGAGRLRPPPARVVRDPVRFRGGKGCGAGVRTWVLSSRRSIISQSARGARQGAGPVRPGRSPGFGPRPLCPCPVASFPVKVIRPSRPVPVTEPVARGPKLCDQMRKPGQETTPAGRAENQGSPHDTVGAPGWGQPPLVLLPWAGPRDAVRLGAF